MSQRPAMRVCPPGGFLDPADPFGHMVRPGGFTVASSARFGWLARWSSMFPRQFRVTQHSTGKRGAATSGESLTRK